MLIKFPRTKLESLNSVPLLHWGTLIFWAAASFFGFLAGANRLMAYEASQARKWPTAKGQVLETGSHKKRICGTGKDSNKCRDDYWADVVYEYEVDSTKHRAKVVDFSEVGRPKREVDAQLAKYPVGSEVTVHYAPSRPSRAYLEIGTAKQFFDAFLGLLGAVAAAALTGFIFNFLWRRHARQIIDIAHGPTGVDRLEQELPEDWNKKSGAPDPGYRKPAPRPPSEEEIKREFEASIARMVPAAKASAWAFVGGLLLSFAWAAFTVVARPSQGILIGGSVVAGLIGGGTLLAAAALTARPVNRRLSGRGRVTFEATWGQVIFALIPIMGCIMALEHINRLRRGELAIGHHDNKPERYGPERGPNLVFFIALALLWPLVGAIVGLQALVSGS